MSKDWNVAKYVVEIEVFEDRDYLRETYKGEKTNLCFEDWVKQHGWKPQLRMMNEDANYFFANNNNNKAIFKSFEK